MNRKKSKCCCIYVKPLEFGESSSEDEDECENCHGHVELKKKNKGATATTPDDSCQTVTMEDDSRTHEDPLDPSGEY
jgi:protein phosphatase 1 regulatory subunit 11